MTLEWTTCHSVEFPDSDIERICDYVYENGWDSVKVRNMINDVVIGFDDCDYYVWGEDQTQEIMQEIKHRLGGVQLAMFNDPFGVPEDYNEGWQ